MRVTVHRETDEEIVIIFEDAYPEIINAIRRSAIRNVPTLAIDNVFIRELDAGMPDERIALRLGLVPLKGPVEKYEELISKEPRRSIPGRIVKETIEKRREKPDIEDAIEYLFGENESGTPIPMYVVRTSDMEIFDDEVKPLYDMPLFVIRASPDSACEIYFEITVGRGKEHAKRSPVTVSASSYMPVLKIKDPEACKSCDRRCIEACPYGALSFDEELRLDREKCDICGLCSRECENIEVLGDEETIVLRIESDGRLEPRKIVCRAIEESIKELERLEEALGF